MTNSNSNFEQMSKSELKAYLKGHPDDTQAFHTLMDKIKAEPNRIRYTFDDPAGEDELRKAVERKRQSKGDAA